MDKRTALRLDLRAGSCVFREGEAGDCAYILEHGRIELTYLKDDRQITITTLVPGDLLGEMALIDDAVRSATARAITDSRLLVLPRDFVTSRMDLSDPTSRLFMSVVLERFRDLRARLLTIVAALPEAGELFADIDADPTGDPDMTELERRYDRVRRRALSVVTGKSTTADGAGASTGRHRHSDAAKAIASSLELRDELQGAVERNELEMHYQAIVDLTTKKLAGFEALVRWNHPQRGCVSPNEFITLAEDTGLIVPIGKMALTEACGALTRFYQSGHSYPIFMSVNLSARQFESRELIFDIEKIFSDTAPNPRDIKFEITETVLMENPDSASIVLERFRHLGASVAMDDFGTGYSSFSYLHRFPIDTLKIDSSFVRDMFHNEKSMEIVRSLSKLGSNLGISIVAEGIENAKERDFLSQLGCDLGQGYLFSKPIPEAEIGAFRIVGASAKGGE